MVFPGVGLKKERTNVRTLTEKPGLGLVGHLDELGEGKAGPEELIEGQSRGQAKRLGRRQANALGNLSGDRQVQPFDLDAQGRKRGQDPLGVIGPPVFLPEFQVGRGRLLAFIVLPGKEPN